MSVSDGQNVNAAVSNAAWLSRLTDSDTVAIIGLLNTAPASGASVLNLQQAINELFDSLDMTGIGDTTRNTYASNNVVTDGQGKKDAIGALDGAFDTTTGHTHNGTDSSNIDSANVTYDNATSGLTATDTQAAIDEIDATLDTTLASISTWTKYTVSHTTLQAAALTNDAELFSLAAQGVIEKVIVKHTTAFAGTGITAYSISVGVTGELDKYAIDFDVFQAVADTTFDTNNSLGMENFGSATSIRIAAESTGANLDQSTAGSVDIYVLASTLP